MKKKFNPINMYEKIAAKAVSDWIEAAKEEMEKTSSPDDSSHKNILYTKNILDKYVGKDNK